MAVVKSKPTSAGRRHQVKVVTEGLHKGRPHAPLLEKKSKTGGRNNAGRITTRHIGGGHKQHYRKIDFKRTKDGIGAKVERIEYDPNRTAHIALLLYADGERRYIIAPKGVAEGAKLRSGDDAGIREAGRAISSRTRGARRRRRRRGRRRSSRRRRRNENALARRSDPVGAGTGSDTRRGKGGQQGGAHSNLG
jgi:hypothetical protein